LALRLRSVKLRYGLLELFMTQAAGQGIGSHPDTGRKLRSIGI
jgi:hypothetical protein